MTWSFLTTVQRIVCRRRSPVLGSKPHRLAQLANVPCCQEHYEVRYFCGESTVLSPQAAFFCATSTIHLLSVWGMRLTLPLSGPGYRADPFSCCRLARNVPDPQLFRGCMLAISMGYNSVFGAQEMLFLQIIVTLSGQVQWCVRFFLLRAREGQREEEKHLPWVFDDYLHTQTSHEASLPLVSHCRLPAI